MLSLNNFPIFFIIYIRLLRSDIFTLSRHINALLILHWLVDIDVVDVVVAVVAVVVVVAVFDVVVAVVAVAHCHSFFAFFRSVGVKPGPKAETNTPSSWNIKNIKKCIKEFSGP